MAFWGTMLWPENGGHPLSPKRELKPWSREEEARLKQLREKDLAVREMAEQLGRTIPSVERKLGTMGLLRSRLTASPYPSYDKPLVWEGDSVVLPDCEFPYQNSDFLQRVLDLADAWKIKHVTFGGDMMHLGSLSAWEPSWAEDENNLLEAAHLPVELDISKRLIARTIEQFDCCDLVLGNHEGRVLRALDNVLGPKFLMNMIGLTGEWRVAPYYFSKIVSEGRTWQVEHPKATARNAAEKLAIKYQCNVLMCHSHRYYWGFCPNGIDEWAHIGAVVDETKLAYAAQRHYAGDPHLLGAAIIKNGRAYLLHQHTDWQAMRRLYGTGHSGGPT